MVTNYGDGGGLHKGRWGVQNGKGGGEATKRREGGGGGGGGKSVLRLQKKRRGGIKGYSHAEVGAVVR